MPTSNEKSQEYNIAGRIIAPASGEPVPKVTVTILPSGLPHGMELGQSVTDKDGRYEVVIDPERLRQVTQKAEEPLSVVLRLSDSKGRVILTTKRPVLVRTGTDVRVDVAAPHLEHGLDWPDMTYIAGEPVNLAAAAHLTAADLLQTYLFLRGRRKELEREELVRRALPGLFARRDPRDDCGEGRFEVIRKLLAERGRLRDLDGGDGYSGDLPYAFYTPRVVVKYTTDPSSPDRVYSSIPTADEPVYLSDKTTLIGYVRAALADLQNLDPNNTLTPRYVQQIGIIAEYALTQYLSPVFGVRDPRGGAEQIEFRIRYQGGEYGSTNPYWSHIEVEPDTAGTDPDKQLSRILGTVPHELWHRVQYRYNDTTTCSGIYDLVREGGARFIEDCVDDAANRYVDSVKVNLFPNNPSTIANSPAKPYGLALFWKYMAEQHGTQVGEPAVGVDAYIKEMEASATAESTDPNVGYDPRTLRTVRSNMPWYGSFDQFSYYDTAATELASHETTWGNYLVANYLHGVATVSDQRFRYLENNDPVLWLDRQFGSLSWLLSQLRQVSEDITVELAALPITRTPPEGQSAWAARYYRIVLGGTAPRMLRVSFDTSVGGMSDPLLQILLLGTNDALLDIHRSDKIQYSKTINLEGVNAVVVIVASRSTPGHFTLQLDNAPYSSDTMITRWNSAVGTEYEVDPRGWSWTWISPDVMVDNNNDGLADTAVHFGRDNILKVRLRNRGNQVANNIQIDFWYQKAAPFLSSTGWMLLRDAAGNVQQLTGQTLAAKGDPASENWFSVKWAPVDDGTHHPHYCVKIKVTVPGEDNTDNKMALSNFSRVTAVSDDVIHMLARLPHWLREVHIHVVPHGPRWTFLGGNLPDLPNRGAGRASAFRAPSDVAMLPFTLSERKLKPWDEKTRGPRPQSDCYYSTDPRTLPPGVNPETLVTVAQFIDRRLTGGVTFQIVTPQPS